MSEATASHSEAPDESQRAAGSTQNDDDDDEDDALGAALFADEDEDANDDVAPDPATTAEGTARSLAAACLLSEIVNTS